MMSRNPVVVVALVLTVGCGKGAHTNAGDTEAGSETSVVEIGDERLCQRIIENTAGVAEEVTRVRPPRSQKALADPLVCAIFGNNTDVARVLLEQGYDPNWRVPADPPVIATFAVGDLDAVAAERQGGRFFEYRRDLLLVLLEGGLDPCQRYTAGTGTGMTAYEVAKESGEANIVAVFEEVGADCGT